MLLTLENIQNQQFNQRFRGYDMAEVDAFLDKIAESYLFLSTENSKIKEELVALKATQSQSFEEEQSFKNAIISAQSFADDIKNKAENHAKRIKDDAKEKSTLILEDAQSRVDTLNDQISILAGEKDQIKNELRDFLNTYLSRIEDDSIAKPQACQPTDVVSMDQMPEFMENTEPAPEQNEEPVIGDSEPELENGLAMEDEEDDVAILYEKIDLDDDDSLATLNTSGESEAPAAMEMELDNTDFATDELDGIDMPDLDGDMLYSLDDPLDNASQEPAVIIDPLQEEEDK